MEGNLSLLLPPVQLAVLAMAQRQEQQDNRSSRIRSSKSNSAWKLIGRRCCCYSWQHHLRRSDIQK
jgi:hypothetical protein